MSEISASQSSVPQQRPQRLFAYLGALWILFGAVPVILNWVNPSVSVTWRTETQIDTAGFNIYRAPAIDNSCESIAEESYVRLNGDLIPADVANTTSGQEYRYVDRDVVAYQMYCYQLEDIEFSQFSERHMPINHTATVSWTVALVSSISVIVGILLIVRSLRMEKSI